MTVYVICSGCGARIDKEKAITVPYLAGYYCCESCTTDKLFGIEVD